MAVTSTAALRLGLKDDHSDPKFLRDAQGGTVQTKGARKFRLQLDGSSASSGESRTIGAEARFQLSNVREPILSMGKLGDNGFDFVTRGRTGFMMRGDSRVPMKMRRNSWYIEAAVRALRRPAPPNEDEGDREAAIPGHGPETFDISGALPAVAEVDEDETMRPTIAIASTTGAYEGGGPTLPQGGGPTLPQDDEINERDLVIIHTGLRLDQTSTVKLMRDRLRRGSSRSERRP